MKIFLIALGLYLLTALGNICAVLEKNSNDTLVQILSFSFIETVFWLLLIFLGIVLIDEVFKNL